MTRSWHFVVAIALLIAVSVAIQVQRDKGWVAYQPATPVLWLQAAPAMERLSLGFPTLTADIYWIRAVIYFGQQRRSTDTGKNYDLLYPLLDVVTALDPRFIVAYRFGAIFLSENMPDGPGRPDQAIRLLERGAARSPDRWEYLHDLGFVYYWHFRDVVKGAEMLERASQIAGAPIWLKATAASMHAEGGDRQSARTLWRGIRESVTTAMLRNMADLRLAQFDAMDALDQLNELLWRHQAKSGRLPQDWNELVTARLLRGIPVDPTGVPYEIDAVNEVAQVSSQSPLWPMPQGFAAAPRP